MGKTHGEENPPESASSLVTAASRGVDSRVQATVARGQGPTAQRAGRRPSRHLFGLVVVTVRDNVADRLYSGCW